MISLVGRAASVARLQAAIADVGAPGSRLSIVGPAGIGKTSVIEAALASLDPAVLVLRCRGIESEMQVPFVGLSDLLAPIIARRGELNATQSSALAGAVAIDDPVPGELLAVRQGALNLVRIVAAERPVVIFADDIPSLDPDSRDCIAFIARRVPSGVTILTSERSSGVPGDADPREPHEVLAPLSPSAARTLVRARRGDIDTAVLSEIVRIADGNPLALVLLADTVTDAQAIAAASLPMPMLLDGSLGSLFAPQVQALANDAFTAVLAAALSGTESRSVIVEACAHLGLPVTAFDSAERAGVIRVSTDRITFTHPLIRERVIASATESDRRRAHMALGSTGSGFTAAWHRAVLTTAPDEEVAAALEAVGHEAARQRALDAAVSAFRRADELSPDPNRAMDRLAHAIRWSVPAGHAELTLRLVAEGVRRGATGIRRAQLRLAEALAHHALDQPIDVEGLLADAEAVEPVAPVLASWLYTSASIDLTMRHSLARARDSASRAIALCPGGEGAAALAYACALGGDRATAQRLLDEASTITVAGPHPSLATMNVRIYLEDDAALLAEIDHGLANESLNSYSGPFAAAIAAEAAFRLGRWTDCARLLDVADDAADALGARRVLTRTLVLRARLHAATGDLTTAHRCLRRLCDSVGDDAVIAVRTWQAGAIGFTALCEGDTRGCVDALEPLKALAETGSWAEPSSVPWAADLVDAYLTQRRPDAAREVAAVLQRQADMTGSIGATAVALRCRGLLAADFEPAFEAALEAHRHAGQPFETARTHLAYAITLLGAKAAEQAAEQFARAGTGFESLGATAWADRVRLGARGRNSRPRSARTTLTPAEAGVAEHAAAGRTNREIADLLFISAKTVETHLGAIYRKLGVRNRVELAHAWPVTQQP